jgi:hypothetical protein
MSRPRLLMIDALSGATAQLSTDPRIRQAYMGI